MKMRTIVISGEFYGLTNGRYELRYLLYKDGFQNPPTLGDVDRFDVTDHPVESHSN